MAKRKVNIKDVAAAAGVHPSTVSLVLSPNTRSIVSALLVLAIVYGVLSRVSGTRAATSSTSTR